MIAWPAEITKESTKHGPNQTYFELPVTRGMTKLKRMAPVPAIRSPAQRCFSWIRAVPLERRYFNSRTPKALVQVARKYPANT
jgi:hypothetical protein